mgnify:CR=1 FL=1
MFCSKYEADVSDVAFHRLINIIEIHQPHMKIINQKSNPRY